MPTQISLIAETETALERLRINARTCTLDQLFRTLRHCERVVELHGAEHPEAQAARITYAVICPILCGLLGVTAAAVAEAVRAGERASELFEDAALANEHAAEERDRIARRRAREDEGRV